MDWLMDPNVWIAFAMLTTLEIVLGIDNIIFISILVGRLPAHQRDKARRLGLGFAMASRLMLLFSLSWVMGLTSDLFTVAGQGISGRDLVLLLGGLFLLYKASHEIFVEVEAREQDGPPAPDAVALEKAIAELKRRTAKLPAPTRLQSGPSRHKGSDLPVGISGPVVRQRKGSSVRDCSLSVSLPRFAGKPQRRSVYIGTENTYSVERYQAALAKAIALRAEAEAQYREAETRSRRAETRVLDPKTDSQPLRKRAAVKAPAVQATVAKKSPAGKKTTAAKAVGKAGSRKAAGASAHA